MPNILQRASMVTKVTLSIEGGNPIPCLFNPKEFSVTKTNNWTADVSAAHAAKPPTFGGGQPREMSVSLLFDSTLPQDPPASMSVKDICSALFKSMQATITQGQTMRPPTMTFTWGEFRFEGVTKSLAIQYQLFKHDGEPIRVDAKLSLMQWDVLATTPQNPTTRSTAGLSAHTVRDGDSLQSIAYRAYGDATRWRKIAEANDIDDPLSVRSGRVLNVPNLDS